MKTKPSFNLIFVLLIILATACAPINQAIAQKESTNTNSLCASDEIDLFSCTTEKKIASICLRDSNKSVQYRFGLASNLELAYPGSAENSINKFSLSTTPYPGGGENRIRFTIGKYNYFIYDVTKNESMKGELYPVFYSGILIRKENKTIASLPCKNEDMSIKPQAFEIFNIEEFDRGIVTAP